MIEPKFDPICTKKLFHHRRRFGSHVVESSLLQENDVIYDSFSYDTLPRA